MSALPAQLNPISGRRLLAPAVVIASLAAAAAGSHGVATTLEGTHPTNRPRTATVQIDRLEAQGYLAAACTREGTLMVNPTTRRRVTVTYA